MSFEENSGEFEENLYGNPTGISRRRKLMVQGSHGDRKMSRDSCRDGKDTVFPWDVDLTFVVRLLQQVNMSSAFSTAETWVHA